MAGIVPSTSSLDDIYAEDVLQAQEQRYDEIQREFARLYGRRPDFLARSPGRVNIIGEHIDYSLYPVLPMAISSDCVIAISSSAPGSKDAFSLRLANTESGRFASSELSLPSDFSPSSIDSKAHDWTNYFKAGMAGALQLLRTKRGGGTPPRDMCILMDGNVPVGGGLSSSAAVVSTSALAVMRANGETKVDKQALTELAIVSERAVGVNSGGMDQSASVLSERGAALLVDFSPKLSARPVHFPSTKPVLRFLVAQSFVTANKHVTGPIHYNLRVVECTLAAAYLSAVLNPPGTRLPADASPLGVSLRGFHETYFYHQVSAEHGGGRTSTQQQQLEKLVTVAKETLEKEEGYTREEIAATLGTDVESLERDFMSKFPIRADRFKLRQRALHVFSEALRVHRFMDVLESSTDATSIPTQLGRLLNETQDSCRDLYECSCVEIDDICEIAREAGALGSRLTGAGWGGCTVHLVAGEEGERAVRAALNLRYYDVRGIKDGARRGAVVVSLPSTGSAVFDMNFP